MISKRERVYVILFIFIMLILISLPTMIADKAGGESYVFNGLLFNTYDGNSYIAKMRQGYDGAWSFTLSYTFESAEGAFIHGFYLFLGHVARWTSLPLIFTFHLFRVIFAGLMFWMLFQFTSRIIKTKSWRWLAFIIASVGSGMGWLGIPFDLFTADFWIAETYPFLTANTNAHFPIALSIQLWILLPRNNEKINWINGLVLAILGLLLAIISPFGVVVVMGILAGIFLWRYLRKEDWIPILQRIFLLGFAAGPLLVYYLWISIYHPVLSQWSIQNQTPSPPVWDLILSLSPALLLAFWGLPRAWKSERKEIHLIMIWMIASLILIYLPIGLQRRFMQGLYIPTVLLAVFALESYFEARPKFNKSAVILFSLLSLPTNLILILTLSYGIRTHAPELYLTADEYLVIQWIDENAFANAHILASPDVALAIPTHSDARVYYAHPFETINAEYKAQALEDFFSGDLKDPNAWLMQSDVEFIFYGQREQGLGPIPDFLPIELVFQSGDVKLYQVIND